MNTATQFNQRVEHRGHWYEHDKLLGGQWQVPSCSTPLIERQCVHFNGPKQSNAWKDVGQSILWAIIGTIAEDTSTILIETIIVLHAGTDIS